MKTLARVAVLLVTLLRSASAAAGGFEMPDNGTEALGRGAAFTAKADDPTAILYNVAGLAQQRGTGATIDANVLFHDFRYQRVGAYPDDPNNPATPWGGAKYPLVRNEAPPFVAPLGALTTDFGSKEFTMALGAFGPASVGNRTFPIGVRGVPSPSRYDYVQSRSLIVFPTLAAAYRPWPWLSVGVGAHLVYGAFDQTNIATADLGRAVCPNPEYEPCDTRTDVKASGLGFTASLGVLARPEPWLAFGINVRGPSTIDAHGQATPTPPKVAPIPAAAAPADLSIRLPWVIRAGLRFIVPGDHYEAGDVEVDATYETWGQQQAQGPRVVIPEISIFKNVETILVHHYTDTFSVRFGGAINTRLGDGLLSGRAGAFYDSSATDPAYTRLDFDTLEKVGGTLGAGYRVGNLSLQLAYAYVVSLPRDVERGAIRPVNPAQGGASTSGDGLQLPAVNAGHYEGSTHVLSLGVGFTFGSGGPFR